MKVSFPRDGTIADLRRFNELVYASVDDRSNSILDLLAQEQRFVMRALKGIRKRDISRAEKNLLISFSWYMAICNRLHITIEEDIWARFPGVCSYCGTCPCSCAAAKPKRRRRVSGVGKRRPRTLAEWQRMFARIYPPERRTLEHAGIHLAEEMGEVGEAVQNYLGLHRESLFAEVRAELADLFSCLMGVATSLKFDVAKGLWSIYRNNCSACHRAPCTCDFERVATFKS